jgi:hypothetical protein
VFRAILTAGAGAAAAETVRHRIEQKKLEATDHKQAATTVGGQMSYDIVGDDFAGSIGAELLMGGSDDDELLQALAVSGLGDSEIIGSMIGASSPQQKARAKAAIRKIAMKNAAGVVQTGLNRRRRYPLGFVPTDILTTASELVPAAPQNLYRPERLVIPSDIAFDIGVRDIKVGNQSQLVQSVEVPGSIFSEVAIDTDVAFDTAEVGNQVSVDARNKSGATVEFSAALIGTVAK